MCQKHEFTKCLFSHKHKLITDPKMTYFEKNKFASSEQKYSFDN